MPKFIRKHPWFFVWTSVILLVTLSLVAGIRLTVNTSIVNQLQQWTQTTRTNDMFDPIIIGNDEGIMEIEITLPNLNMIDNEFDSSDVFVRFGRIANPIVSVLDWVDRGQYLTDLYLDGVEYDDYCDNPDFTDTYYTHFYISWDTGYTIAEGYTYVLILDFYDGDGEFWMCEDLWTLLDWFGEEEFPLNIVRPPRPTAEGMSINIDPEEEEEIQNLILNCDYVSFFEYQEGFGVGDEPTTPPTGTPPPTGGAGAESGGWMNAYDIFPSMQNWVFLILLVLLFGIFGFIIFIIVYFSKKKKK